MLCMYQRGLIVINRQYRIFLLLICEQKKLQALLLMCEMSIADDKDTSILGSSYIRVEGTNSHERLEAPDDRCMARGSVCCLCTYNESIHRTVTLQFLSSAPW